MNLFHLAACYVMRKKAKSILLFFVFSLVNTMILSTAVFLRTVDDSLETIREKSDSKIVAEIEKEDVKISAKDVKQIRDMKETAFINRVAKGTAVPVNFQPISGSDAAGKKKSSVSLLAYDDSEKDSIFFEGHYRLLEGKGIEKNTSRSVIINAALAQANGLTLGDMLELETADDRKSSAKIIGLFTSGREEKQPSDTLTAQRMENQIFTDHETYSALFGQIGYYKIAVYTNKPQQLSQTQEQLRKILGEKAELTTSDVLYRQMEAPLRQISKVTRLMLALTLLAGTVVLSLLLCMWIRTRQKEMGIFISMGRSRSSIGLQAFAESAAVFLLSIPGVCGLGAGTAKILQNLLISKDSSDLTFQMVLRMSDVGRLMVLGGCIVLIAVSLSLFPIFRTKPGSILSRMEG